MADTTEELRERFRRSAERLKRVRAAASRSGALERAGESPESIEDALIRLSMPSSAPEAEGGNLS